MRRSARGVVVDFAELTDPGHDPAKQVNEDSSGCAETPRGLLAVVCDGMGGHAGGQQASQIAVQTIVEHVRGGSADVPPRELLREAVELANRAVFGTGGDAAMQVRPGSTCVATLLHEDGATIAHVGDSRLYLIRSGKIYRMTRDHSIVQQMIDAGVLSADQAADHPDSNKITRALGMTKGVEVEVYPAELPLGRGDVLVLATDGLTDLMADAEIQLVTQGAISEGPESLAKKLVRIALDRGGHDNVTVQALFVEEVPARPVAQPTLVEGTPADEALRTIAEDAAPTRISEAAKEPARPPAPLPTLVDAPSPDRTTEPGIGVPAQLRAAFPRFVDIHASFPPLGTKSGRLLVYLAAAVTALIVGAVLTWWILGPRLSRSADVDEPPPPAAKPAALDAATGGPPPGEDAEIAGELAPDAPPASSSALPGTSPPPAPSP